MSIFDRADLGLRKEIVDVQYITAMNPTCGSFRLASARQRHFATVRVRHAGHEDLKTIYEQHF